jgi:hypothetical protein
MSHEYRGRQYNEKDEKNEKSRAQEEKSWEEKWRRDPINTASWAIIIIWAGLVLLADNLGLFDDSFLKGWPLFFVGAAVILLLEIVFRLLVPAYREPFAGNFVIAIIFLAIGLGGLINWNLIWAVALIAIGAYALLRGVLRPR